VQNGSSGRRHRVRERNARQQEEQLLFYFFILFGKEVNASEPATPANLA
jgi:hypothetical protein